MENGTCFLAERGVLKIVGDATALLHKVITNTMLNFPAGESRYSALLTPQGKLLFDFFILPSPEGPDAGYLIDCVKEQSADLVKRINFHKMRAKFTVEDQSEAYGVAAFWGSDPAPAIEGGIIYRDMRATDMGSRIIAPREALAKLPADASGFEAHRISLGVPKGGVDFPYGDTFLHDANIDRCNGVDFKKGCYVGQEVVARVHFRRSARKRIVQIHFDGPAPAAGTQARLRAPMRSPCCGLISWRMPGPRARRSRPEAPASMPSMCRRNLSNPLAGSRSGSKGSGLISTDPPRSS